MNTVLNQEILSGALRKIKYAATLGFFDGTSNPIMSSYVMNSCSWYLEAYHCTVIFTRDIGHHSSGWWKNPEYERCWHLSISFRGGNNKKALEKILDGLFGGDKRKIWIEPPFSKEGKRNDVWHYRLFCDQFWQPIIPRGEVYSKEFTENGWKSYSELHGSTLTPLS